MDTKLKWDKDGGAGVTGQTESLLEKEGQRKRVGEGERSRLLGGK